MSCYSKSCIRKSVETFCSSDEWILYSEYISTPIRHGSDVQLIYSLFESVDYDMDLFLRRELYWKIPDNYVIIDLLTFVGLLQNYNFNYIFMDFYYGDWFLDVFFHDKFTAPKDQIERLHYLCLCKSEQDFWRLSLGKYVNHANLLKWYFGLGYDCFSYEDIERISKAREYMNFLEKNISDEQEIEILQKIFYIEYLKLSNLLAN